MGHSRLAALLLPLHLLLFGPSASAGIGCPCLPQWNSRCLLASPVDDSFIERSAYIPCLTKFAGLTSPKPWGAWFWNYPCCLRLHLASTPSGLQQGWFHHLVQKSKKSYAFQFCRRHTMPASAQRKLLSRYDLSEKGHPTSVPSQDISHKRLRFRRTQLSDPQAVEGFLKQDSQRHKGPEFSFDLLPEARAIRVSIPPGLEVNVRLCHQWVLECEELSSPFDAQVLTPNLNLQLFPGPCVQLVPLRGAETAPLRPSALSIYKMKTVSWGHPVDLPYEFLQPCLCIEASYVQEDTVRRRKCPFQSWPEAYGSDFWKSVKFTDYSQQSQMVMVPTLHCPLKLEASLCQRQGWHSPCEDLPNATVQESEGRYVLEKVDLHPQLCFKFSFGNSSHVECPHETAPAWNVSMDTQAQQLILHFSTRMHATFSAAWSHPDLGQDSLVPPVYSVSQTQGSGLVTLELIIPFLRPGGCVLVWRSDVQFAWKRLLCPEVSHRRLGLVILALLTLTTLLGVVLVLNLRRPFSGPSQAQPVLLLHAADSEAQRCLVGALAELLRATLGGGRDVIVDLWEGTRTARVGPVPWLWAARGQVAQEQGTVLLLWSSACSSPAGGLDPRTAPLCALLRAVPRPLLLLVYFSGLCTKGDIPPPLRALPRYRLLRDLPRLLRALGAARPFTQTTGWGRLGARPCLRSRLELCRRLEREAAKLAHPRLNRAPGNPNIVAAQAQGHWLASQKEASTWNSQGAS